MALGLWPAHHKQGFNSYASDPSEEVFGREYHFQPRVILAPDDPRPSDPDSQRPSGITRSGIGGQGVEVRFKVLGPTRDGSWTHKMGL